MPQTILYYPTINIEDGLWLRSALLYWDSIASIVPYEEYDLFSPELDYLKQCNIYKPIYPNALIDSIYAADFEKTIIRRLKYHKNNQSIESKKNIGIPKKQFNRIHKSKIFAFHSYDLLHTDKVMPNLYKILKEEKIIEDYNNSSWLKIRDDFTNIYMRTLAEYLIKTSQEDIVIGTDKEEYIHKIYYKTYYKTSRNNKNACLKISIKNCLPLPVANTAIEDLLLFKEKYRDDYLIFKHKLLELEINLLHCNNEREYKILIEDFKTQWESSLLKNKSLFQSNNIKWVLGTFSALIGAIGVGNTIGELIGESKYKVLFSALAGIVELSKEYVNYKNIVKNDRNSAGFAYLLKAQNNGIIK